MFTVSFTLYANIQTVLLQGFQFGSFVQSHSCRGRTDECSSPHFKLEKKRERRDVDRNDGGGGLGLVGGRSGGRLPDMAGCGGGRVTGLDDITSCPAAFH